MKRTWFRENKNNMTVLIKKISFPALMLSFAFLLSCEKTIHMDIKNDKRRIVVNGVVSLQNTISVNISRSVHILNNQLPEYITNARILLFKNKEIIDTMYHVSGGNYSSHSIFPVLKAEYSIKVFADDLDFAEASDRVPSQVPIISIDTATVMYAGNGGGHMDGAGGSKEMLKCIIRFKDIAGEQNYYQVTLENASYNSIRQNVMFETDDPMLGNQELNYGALFDDAVFEGQTYDFTIFVDKYYEGNVYFQLASVSKSYYLYFKTLGQYQQSSGNPFSEPVMVYNNITNGLGVFAACAPSRQAIRFTNSNTVPHP